MTQVQLSFCVPVHICLSSIWKDAFVARGVLHCLWLVLEPTTKLVFFHHHEPQVEGSEPLMWKSKSNHRGPFLLGGFGSVHLPLWPTFVSAFEKNFH